MPRHDTTVLRYEAWTLPWSGDFHRVVASIPVVEGSGRGSIHFREVAGEGSMDIDLSNFDRLDDIISDTTGTLIRVFDGTEIIHEWLAERVNRINDDENRIASVSGPSLQSSFDKWVVYPWDYPKNPSLQPDWVYGGRNLISNPSFEDNADIPTTYTIYTTASSGSFSISDGIDATDPIAFNATPAQLETRLENDLGLITDVLVTGEGTEDNRWEIEFVNPSFGVTLSLDSHTLNGDIFITPTQTGGPSYSPAMKSQTVSVGSGSREYGAYTAFEITTAQAHSGTHSLLIDPAAIPPRYAGVQWVVNVKPGTIHQVSVWIRPTSGTNKYRFVVRAPGGGSGSVGAEGRFIDSDTGGLGGTSFPANTWSQITISDMEIPDDVSTIIVRLANVDATGNPAPFYVDDVSLTEGFAPSTLGLIATDLLNDASLDHLLDDRGVVLDWVDYSSFDETNDSSSEAWDQEISVNIPFGFTYGQVWDTFTDLGYEWELVPKATPTATLTHDLHWYNKTNRDDNPSTAINVRQGVVGGSVLKRIPGFSAAIIEAGGGVFREQDFASGFGRTETFSAAREAPDDDTLDKLLDELLNDQATNRVAAQFSLVATHDHSRALVDYRPGDTVPMQMPPNLPKEARRVQQVSYVNNYPTEYVVVGSRVFMGEEAGGWELVRRLWRRFLRRDKDTTQAHPFLGGGGGFSIDVAAADAPDWEKAQARYICDGVDDHVEILAAMADSRGTFGFYGDVKLSSGSFHVDLGKVKASGIHLKGVGTTLGTTFINQESGVGGNPRSTDDWIIESGSEGHVSGVTFHPTNDFIGTCLHLNYGGADDIRYSMEGSLSPECLVWISGSFHPIRSLFAWGGHFTNAMVVVDEGWVEISGIYHNGTGTTLRLTDSATGNSVISNIVQPGNPNAHNIIMESQGGLALSNVSARTSNSGTSPGFAFIFLDGYPIEIVLSNINFTADFFIKSRTSPSVAGLDSLTITNVVGTAYKSFLNVVDMGDFSANNVEVFGGTEDGIYIEIGAAADRFRLSEFYLKGFDGNGIVVATLNDAFEGRGVKVHDGLIECGEHGVVLDHAEGVVHDVDVTAGLEAANTYDAFQIHGASNRSFLHHNRPRNKAQLRYGINIVDATVVEAVVTDNLLGVDSDYGTAAINDDGTDTILGNFGGGSGGGGGGASELSDLTDADTTGVVNDDFLRYDDTSSLWLPTSVAPGSGATKYSETIGNGTDTTITVTHNLGTAAVLVAVYDLTGADPIQVYTDVLITGTNTIDLVFASAPGTNERSVVVIG